MSGMPLPLSRALKHRCRHSSAKLPGDQQKLAPFCVGRDVGRSFGYDDRQLASGEVSPKSIQVGQRQSLATCMACLTRIRETDRERLRSRAASLPSDYADGRAFSGSRLDLKFVHQALASTQPQPHALFAGIPVGERLLHVCDARALCRRR